jgi:hypothetical protein
MYEHNDSPITYGNTTTPLNPSIAKEKTAIEEEVLFTGQLLDQLGAAVDRLEAALGSALSPDLPSEAGENDTPPRGASRLYMSLQATNFDIQRKIRWVNSIRTRVEL